MKENKLTVLKVEPGKAPEEVTIPNTLDAMQHVVGGYIEVVYLEDACLVCNEEGKLIGLEGNRRVAQRVHSCASQQAATIFVQSGHKVISLWLYYNSMVCPSSRQTTRALGTRARKASGVSPWMGIIP